MSETWCPFATKRPMPYVDRLPKRDAAKTVILHTNGGGTNKGSLFGWFSRPGNDICSHFQVAADGRIEQYVPLERQAYAQYAGNAYGISIETEDDGHPATPWTPAQLASIIRLCEWVGVPVRVSPDGSGGGVGWHSLYEDWNQSHHNCPGPVRVAQIHSAVLPSLGRAPKPKPPHPTPAGVPHWYHRALALTKPPMHGADVVAAQHGVGMPAAERDGIYGPQTAAAVKRYQAAHHVKADGVVGPATATLIGN